MTGADGSASADFSSPREGELDVRAESFDAQQDKIVAESDVQVTANKEILAEEEAPPTLSVSADKSSYQPGQQAIVTIDTQLARRAARAAGNNWPATPAHKEAWALMTLEGENLGIARVVHLTGRKTTVPIPLAPRDSPGTTVHVAVIEDEQVYEHSVDLAVAVPGKDLAVALTADKPKYEPGDTATYTVSARDSKGAGVASDVSLGVVDASIYDIQEDTAEDLKSFFYGNQAQESNSDYSFAERTSAESLFAYGGEMGRAGYGIAATETVSAPAVMAGGAPASGAGVGLLRPGRSRLEFACAQHPGAERVRGYGVLERQRRNRCGRHGAGELSYPGQSHHLARHRACDHAGYESRRRHSRRGERDAAAGAVGDAALYCAGRQDDYQRDYSERHTAGADGACHDEAAGGGTFPIDYSDGDVGYTRQETRDDRVEFYFDSLP